MFMTKYFTTILSILLIFTSITTCEKKPSQWEELSKQWQCPEWFQDVKFGLWLHWGPQTVPAKGGGWYARHMYMEPHELGRETWGQEAWNYHRKTWGHQSDFGYKDICNVWKAEKFNADSMMIKFKQWGARYVAIMGNHHDNFDLFYSSVHGWNNVNVGPKRDLVGEFAKAARRHNLPWAVSVHAARARNWFKPAFGSDSEGPRKDEPYDGHLTKEDGVGTWWDGLDPQQLYASNYDDFEIELGLRHMELIKNYQPDLLYFDDARIPSPMLQACVEMYANSLKQHGSIQTIVTVKKPQKGTVQDYEKGVAEEMAKDPWQTDTTIASDWFHKPNPDGSSAMRHSARSLKELLVDIVSKRGTLLLNIAVRADGTIPQDQIIEIDAFSTWLQGNGEAIYSTRPWKTYGEGGETTGGHFNERGLSSEPWDHRVLRFTRNKANSVLYVFVFGDPSGKEIVIASLAGEQNKFNSTIKHVAIIGSGKDITWSMKENGLNVSMPSDLAFTDCNVIKVETTGL